MCKVCDSAAIVQRAAEALTAACRAKAGQIRLPRPSAALRPLTKEMQHAFGRIDPPPADFAGLLNAIHSNKGPK